MWNGTFSWNIMPGVISYDYSLYEMTIGGALITSGNTSGTSFVQNGLFDNTQYKLEVLANCEASSSVKSEITKTTGKKTDWKITIGMNIYFIDEVSATITTASHSTTSINPPAPGFVTTNAGNNPIGLQHWTNTGTLILNTLTATGDIDNKLSFKVATLLGGSYYIVVAMKRGSTILGYLHLPNVLDGTLVTVDLANEFGFNFYSIEASPAVPIEFIVVYVTPGDRSVTTTNYLNTLWPGMNYPTV